MLNHTTEFLINWIFMFRNSIFILTRAQNIGIHKGDADNYSSHTSSYYINNETNPETNLKD